MSSAEGATIIGPNTKIVGEISGIDTLTIQGEVEGSISVSGGKVTVAEHGRVRGSVFAQEILVAGRVQGDLKATSLIRLLPNALVVGDVTAPRFVMELDSLLRGHVDPSDPSASVEESHGATQSADPVSSKLPFDPPETKAQTHSSTHVAAPPAAKSSAQS